MLSLSPAKLLVILIIALVVLGPEKLPQVARQLGALWHDLRQWRSRMESEVRGAFPNLPPTHELSQAVRSPLAFLDRLADEHERAMSEEADQSEVPRAETGTEATGPAPPLDAAAGPSGIAPVAPNGIAPVAPNGIAPVAPNGIAPVAPTGNGSAPTGSAEGKGSGTGTYPAGGAAAGSDADAPARRGLPAMADDPNMN